MICLGFQDPSTQCKVVTVPRVYKTYESCRADFEENNHIFLRQKENGVIAHYSHDCIYFPFGEPV